MPVAPANIIKSPPCIHPNLPLHLTCDFNVDPMCWCLAHKDDKNIYFFDELVIENTTTQQAIDEFLRRYPNHQG